MNTNLILLPDGYAPATGNNSFTSNWLDKRSGPTVCLTMVLLGANAPTGTAIVQGSNVPEQYGGSYGGPQGGASPVDVFTVATTSQSITAQGTAAWDLCTGARWVRVVYTASSSVAGLTAYCYGNAPYSSPG